MTILYNVIQVTTQILDRQPAYSVPLALTVRMTSQEGTSSCALQVQLTMALMELAKSVLLANSVR